jgi:hypothetical protein
MFESVPATTKFIQNQFPIYLNQNPSSLIVEQLATIEIVSYIYASASTNNQVVIIYNKTSG